METGLRTPEIQRILENLRGNHLLHYGERRFDEVTINVDIILAVDCMVIQKPDIIIPKQKGSLVKLRETTTTPDKIVEQVIEYHYNGIYWEVYKIEERTYDLK